jgi:hypothetical protein
MKWVLFTSGCVIALVTLGFLAVDERDVVWEGRKPLCGYCRAELPYFAVVCRECNRSLDWRSNKEECRWCLGKQDKEHLLDLYKEMKKRGPLPESLSDLKPYLEAIDVGSCTYCGGLGWVMDGGKEVDCPVCRGEGHCIACGGGRSVVIGDEGAHRRWLERQDVRARAMERAEVADLPLNLEKLVDDDVGALRGYVESEELTDAGGRNLLDLAHERLKTVFRELHEEERKREKETGGS